MFGLGWDQIIIILLVGIFLLGPERIPTAVQWVAGTVRKLRTMAAGAQAQLRTEIGPELDELRRQIADLQSFKEIQELRELKDLNPRKIISRNILGDDFKGGVSGLLGLGPDLSPPSTTGSGVAAPGIDISDELNQADAERRTAQESADAHPSTANGSIANGSTANGSIANGPVANGSVVNLDKPDQPPAGMAAAPFGASSPPFDADAT